jgi:hypothetical protein
VLDRSIAAAAGSRRQLSVVAPSPSSGATRRRGCCGLRASESGHLVGAPVERIALVCAGLGARLPSRRCDRERWMAESAKAMVRRTDPRSASESAVILRRVQKGPDS